MGQIPRSIERISSLSNISRLVLKSVCMRLLVESMCVLKLIRAHTINQSINHLTINELCNTLVDCDVSHRPNCPTLSRPNYRNETVMWAFKVRICKLTHQKAASTRPVHVPARAECTCSRHTSVVCNNFIIKKNSTTRKLCLHTVDLSFITTHASFII